MSLLNPVLLSGLGLALIPVILHLMMRTKPKRVLFPALRLIQNRKRQNVRRIRLRHLWLLLLRTLIIAALVFALTRPSLPSANYALNTQEMLVLAGISAVALAAYFGLMAWWRRRRVPNHTLASRRTSLRGGLGLAAVVLALIFVAWPWQERIAAEITSPMPEIAHDQPVAGVILFDTSLSMEYRLENLSRLDEAKRIALDHLDALPRGSRVAIADASTTATIPFHADLSGARRRIESIETGALSYPLNDRLRMALRLLEEDRRRTLEELGTTDTEEGTDHLLREVYIFTDFARSAWKESAAQFLRSELERLPWVQIYLIDVGVESPTSVALTNLKLSDQEIADGAEVKVEATVSTEGPGERSIVVELYTEGATGEPIKQGKQTVHLTGGDSGKVTFFASPTAEGTLRGELRLVASDPIQSDNQLWFSVGTRPAIKTLVSARARSNSPQSIEASDANELFEALNVLQIPAEFVPAQELDQAALHKFDVVFLVNLPTPDSELWERLGTFVSEGGGLFVFLGSAAFGETVGVDAVDWNVAAAQEFLPGRLDARLKFSPPRGLDVSDAAHPVLAGFDAQGIAASVAQIPVWRYWKTTPSEDANVIARFTGRGGVPALLERSHGSGRTMMLTTAGNLSRDINRQWSRLAGEWPFVMLIDRSLLYLARRTEASFNSVSGEDILIQLDRHNPMKNYLLRKPSGIQLPGEVDANARMLRIAALEEVGHFTVKSATENVETAVGFSVNSPPGESDFTRLTAAELDTLFGEERYATARSLESLTRTVTTGRLGMEAFPMILGLLIIFFCLEMITANRFYEADQTPQAASA